jgi:hypothetical protein
VLDSGNHLRISPPNSGNAHPPIQNQIMLLFPKLTKQQEKMVLEQKLTEQMNQESPKKYALPDIGSVGAPTARLTVTPGNSIP